jgi:hypothetical protein
MKTIEQNFADWESGVFGFGYGSGEEHVLGALKAFLAGIERNYDYRDLEVAVTPTVAWLLINALGHDDKIEYGTSPRFGWLTKSGRQLAAFTRERSVEQLVGATDQGDDYIHCYTDHCNCDDGDCRPSNPFWKATR